MNPTWTDAKDWLDILDHVWIGLVVIMAAVVPSLLAARNHKSITDIKDQVVNGHQTPMRFDLDRVLQAIDDLSANVRHLRRDLMAEEDHRRIQISDLREELDHRTGKHRRL